MTLPVEGYHYHPSIEDMETVKKILEEKLDVEVGEIQRRTAFSIRDILITATSALKAKVVVELGTGGGYTANAFLSALNLTDGVLYSVDLNPDHEPVKSAIERLKNNKRFNLIPGDSVEAGQRWSRGNIDILLCDSDHSEQHVFDELVTWGRFNPKLIFIHDTLGVNDEKNPPYLACEKYANGSTRLFFNLNFRHGLGIIV